jgi:uncharacterized protein (UPF0276 family)
VWDLFEIVIATVGPIATLIEWDQDIPQFSTLLADAQRANARLTHYAGPMVAP